MRVACTTLPSCAECAQDAPRCTSGLFALVGDVCTSCSFEEYVACDSPATCTSSSRGFFLSGASCSKCDAA